jgi:hypothetical protein
MKLRIVLILVAVSCSSSKSGVPDNNLPATPDGNGFTIPDGGAPRDSLPASPDGNVPPALDGGAPRDGGANLHLDSSAGTGVDAGARTFRFAPEIVARGCAKALACANNPGSYAQGLGHCAADLALYGALDLKQQTMLLSFNDNRDWLLELALMQNMDCVQAASGCTAILACLNQGQAQPLCTAPAGYGGQRRCSDGTHLRGCSFSDSSMSIGGVETTFDCAELGLECVETAIPWSGMTFAACAARVATPKPASETVTVACQGDLARFEFGDGAYTFDCGTRGATCVPGDYPVEDGDFCAGKRATTCDAASFTRRCEGDMLVECIGPPAAASSAIAHPIAAPLASSATAGPVAWPPSTAPRSA